MEVFASLHYYTNLPFVWLTAPYSTTIFRDTERGFKPRIKAHADGGNGGILPTENTSLFSHPQRGSASLGGRRLEAKMATERFDLNHSAPPCAPGRSMHSTNSTVAHPAASTVLYGLGKTNFAPVLVIENAALWFTCTSAVPSTQHYTNYAWKATKTDPKLLSARNFLGEKHAHTYGTVSCRSGLSFHCVYP